MAEGKWPKLDAARTAMQVHALVLLSTVVMHATTQCTAPDTSISPNPAHWVLWGLECWEFRFGLYPLMLLMLRHGFRTHSLWHRALRPPLDSALREPSSPLRHPCTREESVHQIHTRSDAMQILLL